MGDRCRLELHVRESDLHHVLEVGLGDYEADEISGETGVGLYFGEVNYGGVSYRADLSTLAPFYGDHGAGGEYDGARFYSLGNGESHEWACDHDSSLTVSITETGDIYEGLEDLRRFIWEYNIAVLMVDEGWEADLTVPDGFRAVPPKPEPDDADTARKVEQMRLENLDRG